jgi:SAM-dependent methyltransferase
MWTKCGPRQATTPNEPLALFGLPHLQCANLCGMSQAWEDEARNWIRWARTSGHDAYWSYAPKFFEDVVPPAAGLTLEIGCGEGRVSRDLRSRGHDVVAIDASPTLVRHAVGADARSAYLIADAKALSFRRSIFDLVVAYNSLMDVDDMPKVVAEAARVLRARGRFCICVTHPINDAGGFEGKNPDAPFTIEGSYFGRRRFDEKVERDGLEMTFHGWLYPLEAYARALEDAGFLIEVMREPQPDPAAVAHHPSLAPWRRVPMFLFLRAEKRDDASD